MEAVNLWPNYSEVITWVQEQEVEVSLVWDQVSMEVSTEVTSRTGSSTASPPSPGGPAEVKLTPGLGGDWRSCYIFYVYCATTVLIILLSPLYQDNHVLIGM